MNRTWRHWLSSPYDQRLSHVRSKLTSKQSEIKIDNKSYINPPKNNQPKKKSPAYISKNYQLTKKNELI